jgi:hypothetical protein
MWEDLNPRYEVKRIFSLGLAARPKLKLNYLMPAGRLASGRAVFTGIGNECLSKVVG